VLEIKIIKNTGSAISAGTVYVDVRLHVHAHVDAYVFAYIYIYIYLYLHMYIYLQYYICLRFSVKIPRSLNLNSSDSCLWLQPEAAEATGRAEERSPGKCGDGLNEVRSHPR
jgi:hypothetical protein